MSKGNLDQIITILQWKKFNPRKDVKHSSWFRMEHAIWFHPDWKHFTGEEIQVWSTLLAIASMINKDHFVLSYPQLSKDARVKEKWVHSALKKLLALECIIIVARARVEDVTSTSRIRSPTDGRTDETDGRDETDETDVAAAPPESPPEEPKVYAVLEELSGDQEVQEFLSKVPTETQTRWLKLYPAGHIKREVIKALGWREENPEKAKKHKSMSRFMSNWLSRSSYDKSEYRSKQERIFQSNKSLYEEVEQGER